MNKRIYILWTNDNPVTSDLMVCMYAHNAKKKKWWDEVTVIIWGATALLVAKDETIQYKLKEMMADGVTVSACKSCADQLGVCSEIESLGIEVKYWGEGLTDILNSNDKLLTI